MYLIIKIKFVVLATNSKKNHPANKKQKKIKQDRMGWNSKKR